MRSVNKQPNDCEKNCLPAGHAYISTTHFNGNLAKGCQHKRYLSHLDLFRKVFRNRGANEEILLALALALALAYSLTPRLQFNRSAANIPR
jgi:hypothetical protein